MNMAWLERYTWQYGPLPDTLVIVDSETSGVMLETDLILELGHCVVKDGVVVETGSVVLDWTRCPGIDLDWLGKRLESTRAKLISDGKSYHWTLDVLQEGVHPIDALADYFVLIQEALREGVTVAGHNIACFDAPLLVNGMRRFLNEDLPAPSNLLDSGAIEKAMQLSWYPEPGESSTAFARRVVRKPAKVKWSLDRHCIPKYQLAAKFGLDVRGAHRAAFDAIATHYLLSVYRDACRSAAKSTRGERSAELVKGP